MKKLLTILGLSAVLVLSASAPALAAAGAGSVKGNTITYTITGIPDNKPKTFSVYLLTNDAQIKCYKSKSNNPPDAKNGGKVNRNNITPAVSKGTTSSKSGLKVTGPDGSGYTVAEKVTFTYDYVNGTFSGTVTIVNPVSSLTGLAFVGRDGSNHYYPIGGVDGTIDISEYVAAASGYGSGGSGGSTGPESGTGSAGSGNSPGSGTGSTGSGSTGGSAVTGGSTGSGSTGGSTGSGGAGGSEDTGGSGSGTTAPAQSQQETEESRKAAEKEARRAENEGKINDIKDKINNGGSGRNGGSGSSGSGSGTGSGKEIPPCVLGRILS